MKQSPRYSPLEERMHQNEAAYREACGVFGGIPHVFRYYDQTDEVSVDILTVEDSPSPGLVSYCTLGLQHHSVGLRQNGKPLRVELTGCCRSEFEYFPNLLSACSFDIINARFSCGMGTVLRECVNMYVPDSPLRNLLFATPEFWPIRLPPLDFKDKTTIWLTALPISDGELAFLEQNGEECLAALFAREKADCADLMRASVI